MNAVIVENNYQPLITFQIETWINFLISIPLLLCILLLDLTTVTTYLLYFLLFFNKSNH